MARILQAIQPFVGVTGRVLLGLYFLIPGVRKIVGFERYCAVHGDSRGSIRIRVAADYHHNAASRRRAAPRRMANPEPSQ